MMSKIDWTPVCGERHLIIWENQDFGVCFRRLAFEYPAYAFLAISSAFYLGNRALYLSRHPHHLHLLTFRKLIVLGLLLCPIIKLICRIFLIDNWFLIMDLTSEGIQVFGWMLHMFFLLVLRTRITVHSRGPCLTLCGWLATVIVAILNVRTYIIADNALFVAESSVIKDIEKYLTYVHTVLQVLYFCTLIPKGRARETVPRTLVSVATNERLPLVADSFSESYGAVAGRSQSPVILGLPEANGNFFSRLILCWVEPLLHKGCHKLLNSVDDLFELPSRLKTSFLDTKFWIVFRDLQLRNITDAEKKYRERQHRGNFERYKPKKVSVLRALITTFGMEYFLLGILKLLADGANFVGPFLLNLIVTFIQEDSADQSEGYYYVLGLFGASLLSAICNAHYSYFLNNIILKVRASVISTIYRKTLHVDSVTMAGFNTGEIVNFMSTDTECITNMCNFHEFWSMPIKIAVCLFLLHQQVGLAYLAGVGFAILLVPINHCIARTIGKLSTSMMAQKDSRVKVMTEVLYGVRVIKLFSWEDYIYNKIQSLRKAEVSSLKGRKYLDAFCVFFWATTPIIIALLTFTTYVLLDNRLTAAKVFTCLALFNMLIIPLNAFPWVIGGMVQGYVSLKRVQKILQVSDSNMAQRYANIDESSSLALYIHNGNFGWIRKSAECVTNDESIDDNSEFRLRDINFEVYKGQFVGIVGPVGSGKTSLLLAIMSEMDIITGELGASCIADGFAYVAQDSWIQNGTIQQNILFGRVLQLDRYYEVLQACALEDDLKSLPCGDETLIGDRGITLSGGQKTRIALARAIYQNKEVYIMDDILSTVDVHVGQHIMQNCIHGLLKNKTRILSTHHRRHLLKADNVVVMSNGHIIRQGNPCDILSEGDAVFESKSEVASGCARGSNNVAENTPNMPTVFSPAERMLSVSEEWEHGTVKWKVYRAYCGAVGSVLTPLILLAILIMQASRNVSDWWLAHWMSGSINNSSASYEALASFNKQLIATGHTHSNPELEFDLAHIGDRIALRASWMTDKQDDHFYLMIYWILAGINAAVSLIRAFSFAYGGIFAAVGLHNNLLNSILKASTRFFDMTPVGRVVNRFSTDTYVIDDNLPFVLNIFLAQSFIIVGTVIIISYSLPWLLLLLVPLAGVYHNIQSYYRHTSRELRRLEAITLSPVYAHFSETVLGLTSIRAFRAEAKFKKENEERLEKNQRTLFALGAAGGWLSLRLQLIGVAVVTGIGFLAILEHNSRGIDPGVVGLALSYGLSITAALSAVVQYFIESEKQLVSVERTLQYIDMVEPERWEGFIKPPGNWPSQGIVAFHNVTLRYREHLPCALNNVSFSTKSCEKLGVVGRTGAGKSSLFTAIFRLVEVERGGITIDNHVLAYLDLKDLRSKVSVIPQDPFIFSGTFRSNLDPYNVHTDEEMLSALCECHLSEVVDRCGGLDAELRERGSGLSMGQRQLLCLARAVLTKAKILCIDEATANIDHETDCLIQTTIREAFKESTVITIAHRLETVIDSDRILVMHEGRVAELDTPQNLMADPNSLFYQLVHKREWS